MAVASAAWVARQFRGLSPAQRRRFLADVWAARGYQTSVEGETVVVEGDETRRLAVIGRWPWRRETADVLVGVADTDRARAYADARDAEFVDPSTLQQVLLYGIDRDDADRIAREYFGMSLLEAPADQFPAHLSPLASLGVFALATMLIIAASLGSGPTALDAESPLEADASLDADAPLEADTQLDADTSVSESTPDTNLQRAAGSIGSTSSGSTGTPASFGNTSCVSHADDERGDPAAAQSMDWERLAQIHQNQITDRPQGMTYSYAGPQNSSLRSGVVSESITYRSNGSRTRYTRTQTLVTNDGETRAWAGDVYVTRRAAWIRLDGEARLLRGRVWEDFQRTLAWPYRILLRNSEMTVTRVRLFGERFRRVTITDQSSDRTDFRAAAYLTQCDRLAYLTVSYVDSETGDPVSVELRYHDIGSNERIPPPAWYRNATADR